MIITTSNGKRVDIESELTSAERHILQKLLLWEFKSSSLDEFRNKKDEALQVGWSDSGPVPTSDAFKNIILDLEKRISGKLKSTQKAIDKFKLPPAFISKESVNITRDGNPAKTVFNAAIVGAGNACYHLLKLLDENRSSRLMLNVLGVSDINPDSRGLEYARKLNLIATSNINDLFRLPGLNLIIELTGSDDIADQILRIKPPDVSFIDHKAIRFLYDLIQAEVEKEELENDWNRYLELIKRQSKVVPDSLPYRIMVVNLDKTVDAVNQTFINAFNLNEEMVIGKPCCEIDYGSGRRRSCVLEGHRCYIDENIDEIRSKGIYSTVEEYQDENGKTHFDIITFAPILDEKGEIIQFLEASRDITENVILEKEAQKSSSFLHNVIQSTVDGIVVVDTEGKVLLFNDGMERLTGFKAEEMINIAHIELFYDLNTARENMKKMRSNEYGPPGKLNPISMTIKSKDGKEIPVTLSASIIMINGKEVGSVGVFTDMREFLEMRKNLEEANLKLFQSEKIASIGRMAAGVAHEINNPLSGIMLYAELLKKNIEKDAETNKQLIEDTKEIIHQTLRCKKIVSELLEFSRQSVGTISPFNVEDLIDKPLNILVNQLSFQDITVIKDIEKNLPPIVGDMVQLQQVFTNLFINAADAMKGKGDLRIEARYNKEDDAFIIRVSDTGPGIPENMQDKIFDIFFTTKPVGKGTGLGLSITKNIIQLHGGSILVDSPLEGGASFIVKLPRGFIEQTVNKPVFSESV